MGVNYNKYKHIQHILRTNETTITLVGAGGSIPNTILTFDTPGECLKKFLEILKENETAWHFEGPKSYRNGVKW